MTSVGLEFIRGPNIIILMTGRSVPFCSVSGLGGNHCRQPGRNCSKHLAQSSQGDQFFYHLIFLSLKKQLNENRFLVTGCVLLLSHFTCDAIATDFLFSYVFLFYRLLII
jgi:hypothetical protein